MSNTPHELQAEFPDAIERLHELKLSDPEMARLIEEYRDVNRAVHRAETRVDLLSEEEEEHLRRRRVRVKDAIARRLRA
jgi:hypothetical protein